MENNTHQTKDYISLGLMKENIKRCGFSKRVEFWNNHVHLACRQGAKEIYLMGFDLSENPLNNVYEDISRRTKMKSDPHRVLS